jgi:hypothetical protein
MKIFKFDIKIHFLKYDGSYFTLKAVIPNEIFLLYILSNAIK